MKKLLLTFLTVSSVAAFADNGFYVGFNSGLASTASTPTISMNGVDIGKSNGMGLGAFAGYSFNDYLAVEVQTVSIAMPSSSIGFASLDETNNYLTLNVKGSVPLNDSFSLVGKSGIGYNFTSANLSVLGKSYNASSTNLAYTLCAGIDYKATQHVTVSLMDQYYIPAAAAISATASTKDKFSFGNSNYVSLGVSYNF